MNGSSFILILVANMQQYNENEGGKNWQGYLLGLLSSSTFGLIPLFSIPVLSQGVEVGVVLMYRFFIASLLVGGMVLTRRESFKISIRSFLILILLSTLYFGSALMLLEGYNYMPSGVATVIHFCYPAFVVILMFAFFRQRINPLQSLAVVLAIGGVTLISGIGASVSEIPIFAVIVVLLSGLCYACYIVVLQHAKIEKMSSYKLTCYVMFLSACLFAIYGSISGFSLELHSRDQWIYIFLLALIPTVCSNVMLVWAVQRIGSTPTAIMGALEPLTAVIVGAIALGEQISLRQGIGIVVVLLAVFLLILSPIMLRRGKRV